MTFSPETTVGELASRFPATVKVFQRRDVQFCCGGHQTLRQVCLERGYSFNELAAELVGAGVDNPPTASAWDTRSIAELTCHLVESFHDPVRHELPRLQGLAARLQGHGDRHRRVLGIVKAELDRLCEDVAAQMQAEEQELFPLLEALDTIGLRDSDSARLASLVASARAYHADTGQTLRILRQITDGFLPPPTACSTLRGLYHGLYELESLTQLHVHLETNVLFSRAAALLSAAGVEETR